MAGIAVGVLVVSGGTTIVLARRSAEQTAIDHLERTAPSVRDQLVAMRRELVARQIRGRPTAPLGRLLASVLRVSGGTIVTLHDDGTITEGVTALSAAASADPASGAPLARGARGRDARRFAPRTTTTTTASGTAPSGAGSPTELPDGLTVDDLDAAALAAGQQQTGTAGGQAFVALPVARTTDGAAVLVMAEKVDSAAVRRARGFFLLGGALALIAAGLVSYFLARRLTRPLAAMGATAGAIAGGDLAARVDLGKHPDDELADLAATLNEMAGQLEAARQGERAFLLSVSHDLRTPLTSIRGYADALTDGTIPASDEQRRAGAVIAAEADRLERLVADLLDLARLDARRFSFTPRPFDVAAGVRTAVAAFEPAAAELGIALAVEVPGDPEGLVITGDADRVAQIVANLVENALKFARARITVGVAPGPNGSVEVRVVDDGPGVDPTEHHRVFERLFVSRSVPGRSVGTGLGLAIVGELAAAMGGRAWVDPDAAGGATFVVRLPLEPPAVTG